MKRGLVVNLSLAAGVSVAFLAALEGLARLVAPAPPAPREVADYIWDWDDKMPGGFYVMRSRAVGWPPWEEFNGDGLRDRTRSREKPEGVWRVAVLGDSVTLGAGIRPNEAYPRLLDERLRSAGRSIEVMSVALWGWSTRQERIAWQRIARGYHPDQAILAVCLNDIPELHNNLARPPRWLGWLHERSALVRVLVRAGGREIEDVERLFESPDAPRVREALTLFFDEVRALRGEVEADGARFTLVVFPFRFQLEAGAPPPVVQERVASFCADEGIPCLDLLGTFERAGPSVFMDYDHLSLSGSSLTADTLLASELLPEGFSHPAALRERFSSPRDPGAVAVREWLDERAHVPGGAGLAALAGALADPDAEVRMAAAWALERLGRVASPAREALAGALRGDASSGVRVAAARALGALGEDGRPAVSTLVDALRDPSEPVRNAAAEALDEVGVGGEGVSWLVGALDSEDTYVRGFAVWTLGNLGAAASDAVPALVATLERPETDVAVAAALARIGPAATEAVPALVEGLRSAEVGRRWRAARTLGRIGPGARDATAALVTALADPNAGVRRHAARALGRVASPHGAAAAALQRATGDPNRVVREEARRALERLQASAADAPLR